MCVSGCMCTVNIVSVFVYTTVCVCLCTTLCICGCLCTRLCVCMCVCCVQHCVCMRVCLIRLEGYVDEKYKQYLKDKDKLDTVRFTSSSSHSENSRIG